MLHTRGGLTLPEHLAWESREALEKDHEKHTVVKLPCCGSMLEILDPRVDNYVTCPNKKCGRHSVVLSGLKHEVRTENVQHHRRLSW